MSRLPQGDRIEIAPQSNIYTALAIAATVAVAVSLLLVVMRAQTLFTGGLFGPTQ